MYDAAVKSHQSPAEAEGLLPNNQDLMEMADLSTKATAEDKNSKGSSHARYIDSEDHADAATSRQVTNDGDEVTLGERAQPAEYRVYKIRWFGLTQLILLNIVVSWDVSIGTILLATREDQGFQRLTLYLSGSPSPPSPTRLPTSSKQPPASSTG